MKSKFLGIIFISFSIIILIFWFHFAYETRQIEKEITIIDKDIFLLKEKYQVLVSEYAAHTNPEYIDKLSSVYLNYNDLNNNSTVVFSKNNFSETLNKAGLVVSAFNENLLSNNNIDNKLDINAIKVTKKE